jgi:flagellar hook assembly protein FlgD
VPNPYYAYSSYETGQLDNRVKITNLPPKCRISIFTLNGHLVRQFTKDNQEPDLDWDLKNQSGVPVASGVYIIHIDGNIQGQNLGEKVVKMFAVMRQIDLDSF